MFDRIGSINFSVLRPDDVFDACEFIPSTKPQFTATDFWKEDEEAGFDVYIDSLHNLPDNCSIVKIIAKIVTHKN